MTLLRNNGDKVHRVKRLVLLAVFSIFSACGWSSASVGPVNFCGASRWYDVLAKASAKPSADQQALQLSFSSEARLHSLVPLELSTWRWGQSPANVTSVIPGDARQGSVAGVPLSGELWVFLRTTEDTSRRTLYFNGLGDLGAIQPDGSIQFAADRFASETEFLSRADAARMNASCAFDPNLMTAD